MRSNSEHLSSEIVFEDVSKFYGEILGINRVNLTIMPGITSLVGPNGSGKTTLMNLMTGLIQPTRGRISILGVSPDEPQSLFRMVGYCGQFDSFPKGMTGYEFIKSFLLIHGYSKKEADEKTWIAIERVDLVDAAHRKVAGYSKGMRQRIRLAQSIAHDPTVMILDEPLNGLDPMARAETIRLFRQLAKGGLHLIISSHILHEVDMMSDRVVLINNGYILAEGGVSGVREEMDEHPLQIMIVAIIRRIWPPAFSPRTTSSKLNCIGTMVDCSSRRAMPRRSTCCSIASSWKTEWASNRSRRSTMTSMRFITI